MKSKSNQTQIKSDFLKRCESQIKCVVPPPCNNIYLLLSRLRRLGTVRQATYPPTSFLKFGLFSGFPAGQNRVFSIGKCFYSSCRRRLFFICFFIVPLDFFHTLAVGLLWPVPTTAPTLAGKSEIQCCVNEA